MAENMIKSGMYKKVYAHLCTSFRVTRALNISKRRQLCKHGVVIVFTIVPPPCWRYTTLHQCKKSRIYLCFQTVALIQQSIYTVCE